MSSPNEPTAGQSSNPHDVVAFMRQVVAELQSEYQRIRARTHEDPGTAGDEGEEDWAKLLRLWLPSTYHVVTKGRILTALGEASPQVDVLVLQPNYPQYLLTKKHYLSSGVLAAFECKNTLRRDGIQKAISNSKAVANILQRERNAPGYERSPIAADRVYAQLHKPLVYGLLAHSHSWSDPGAIDVISQALVEIDLATTQHPREILDIVCVADLAVWSAGRCATSLPAGAVWSAGAALPEVPDIVTSFTCLHAGGWAEGSIYFKSFTTIGALITRLYEKISYLDVQARMFGQYFKLAMKDGRSGGGQGRRWGDVLSPDARATVSACRDWRNRYWYW